jgi:hypothetical protein
MARPSCRDALVALPCVLAIAAIAGGSGCSGHDPYRPGESVGAFHVTSKLVSTSCGPTPDPWEFDVKLRHDSTTLFWVQGSAPIAGQLDAKAHAVMKTSVVNTVRAADAKTQTAACTMSRSDVVDLVLAPTTAPVMAAADVGAATSFKGTLAYQFTVVEGSSCEDQLTELGGDFAALPCTVSYEIAATRTGDAK